MITTELTVPIECVHPREILLTSFTRIRANVEVQLLVPFTVVLPGKALAATRPLALERFLFRMRPQVTCQTDQHCQP